MWVTTCMCMPWVGDATECLGASQRCLSCLLPDVLCSDHAGGQPHGQQHGQQQCLGRQLFH